jgi:tetratricopeptide (TPR) repeat protein
VAEFAEAARLVKAQGRTEEFLRVAERLLHYEPDNHAMAMEVAAKYLDHNNARAALSRLKSVFEANQRDPAVLDLLARTFEQLGQPHKTLPVLKELARVYAESGRISERNQAAQRALSMDPNDAEMQELLGRPHSSMNRTPQTPATSRMTSPSPLPSLTPLPLTGGATGVGKRPVSITFSEMEVPQALRNKYVSLPAEPMAASMSERINIASGLVEKPDDDAEVKRILAEADVFVKYGLVDRAADHLRRVFDRVPTHQGAHERLAAVLVQLGRKAEAAAEYEVLAQQFTASKPAAAAGYARKALELNPTARRALEVLGMVAGALQEEPAPEETDSSISSEMGLGTPEPDIIESGEIELLGEPVEPDDFGGSEGGAAVAGNQDRTRGGADDADAANEDHVDNLQGAKVGNTPMPEVVAQEYTEPTSLSATHQSTPSGSDDALLADLEQVDFFIEQGLTGEAVSMLDELEFRFPGHLLIADRREKLAVLESDSGTSQGAVPAQVHGGVAESTRNMRKSAASSPHGPAAKAQEHDTDTHADLGIMEKTMERFGAAIEHFKAVMEDPKREVFALSMIGECSEALGESAEAIRCYQDALKRPTATAAEATQLYFQLGNVFYNLGDHSEALYYFERVYKRDANFRDIQRRLADVKSRSASR